MAVVGRTTWKVRPGRTQDFLANAAFEVEPAEASGRRTAGLGTQTEVGGCADYRTNRPRHLHKSIVSRAARANRAGGKNRSEADRRTL